MSTPIPKDISTTNAWISAQMDVSGMSPDYVQATIDTRNLGTHQPLPPLTLPHSDIISSCLFQAGIE